MEERRLKVRNSARQATGIDVLDDACLARIFSHLMPMPDRFNVGRVCKQWQQLACDRRMWLRVDPSPLVALPGIYKTVQEAVSAARPGDTILVAPGTSHQVLAVRIDKPLCLIGGGASQDDTLLICPRGWDGALEFHANARVANLTVRAELGNCLVHCRGRLVVENCTLQCDEHPLEHLVCPIVTTAPALSGPDLEDLPLVASLACTDLALEGGDEILVTKSLKHPVVKQTPRGLCGGLSTKEPTTATAGAEATSRGAAKRDQVPLQSMRHGVKVVETRIEGGERAVRTSGGLALQQVRVMYARAALIFWFILAQQRPASEGGPLVPCDATS